MKILTVVGNAVPGFMGGELRVALDLSKGYIEIGYECEILTFGKKTEEMPDEWELKGIKVRKITTPKDHSDYDYYSIRTMPTLVLGSQIKFLKKIFINYDVIHIHNMHSIRLMKDIVEAKKKTKVKMLWTVHDYWFCCPKQTLLDNDNQICDDFDCFNKCLKDKSSLKKFSLSRKNDTIFLNNVDIIVAPSKFMKEQLINFGFNKKNVKLIYNGITNVKVELNTKKSVKDLFYIGSPWPHKGLSILLQAINSLVKINPEISLHIIGDLSSTPDVKKQIKKQGLSKYIRIHGKVSEKEKIKLLSSGGMFILPSIWPEVFGLVNLESMALGLPVIASKVGGVPEIVIDQKTGILIEPNNPEALSDAIMQLISNNEFRMKMGKCGNKIYNEHFTAHHMVENYLNMITELNS